MQYQLDGTTYDVVIVRKNNKNTYLRVKDGQIIVSTNHLVSVREIKKILDQNQKFLLKALCIDWKEKQKERDTNLYIWGHICEIKIGYSHNEIKDNVIYLKKETDLDKFLTDYMKKVFLEHLKRGYNRFEEDIPFPKLLRIRKMKTRWGVCNTKKKIITLNSELLHYDIRCLDYVIIHELSHLVYADHSWRFWKVVAKYCPNYKEIKKLMRRGSSYGNNIS